MNDGSKILIGKIFTCVLLLLSIVIFALSLSFIGIPDSYWAGEILDRSNEIKDLKKETKLLQDATDNINARIALYPANSDYVFALDSEGNLPFCNGDSNYVTGVNSLIDQFNRLQKDNTKLHQNRRDALKDTASNLDRLNATQARLREMRQVIPTLEKNLAVAQQNRAGHLQTVATAINQKHELETIRANLEAKNVELIEDNEKAVAVLNIKGLEPDPSLYAPTAQVPVNGTIVAVQEGPRGLLLISIGKDDGIEGNHILEVYRDGSYLGKIEVVAAEENRAVCRVLPRYRQGTMVAGDTVTSRLEHE